MAFSFLEKIGNLNVILEVRSSTVGCSSRSNDTGNGIEKSLGGAAELALPSCRHHQQLLGVAQGAHRLAAVLLKQNGTGSNYVGIGLNLFIVLVAALEFKVISGKSVVLVKPVSDRTHRCEAAGRPRR